VALCSTAWDEGTVCSGAGHYVIRIGAYLPLTLDDADVSRSDNSRALS